MKTPFPLALVAALPMVFASTQDVASTAVRPSVFSGIHCHEELSPSCHENSTTVSNTPPNNTLLRNVIEWIRDNGGYVHPNQEFQFGRVFASESIPVGQLLLYVPQGCIVTAKTDEDSTQNVYCNTANRFMEEVHKGDKSLFGPYIKYLLDRPQTSIPGTYTPEGEKVLKKILGKKKLPPKKVTNFVNKYWKGDCHGSDDSLELQAVMLQLASLGNGNNDEMLIPLLDFYKHRNGHFLNTRQYFTPDQDYIVKASQTIVKGQEIYISYNQCSSCEERRNTFGTPEIFRNYGLVEEYPQRWIFPNQYIAFDVEETNDNRLEVTWLDDDVSPELDDLYEVSEWGINVLSDNLERLQKLNKTLLQPLVEKDKSQIPQRELDSILQYYRALTTAMELAIEASKDYEYIVPYERDDEENENNKKQAKKSKKKKKSKRKERFAPHLSQAVKPGELSLLKWKDDGSVIDPFAAQVGLPKTLVPTIQTYANQLGIFDMVRDVLYKDPCEPKGGRFYHVENPFASQPRQSEEFPWNTNNDITKEMIWYAQRPGSEWQSDMHWLGPSDERTHEVTVRMLFEGGFGQVLDAIGTHYNLDGLMIQGIGFLAVSHCEEGYLHTDFKRVEGKVFNFLIPLYSPPDSGPELKLVGKRWNENKEVVEEVTTDIKYDSNYGVLVGDGTWHATKECDHRPLGDVRIVVSIYLADLTEDNLERVSYDDTAIFPVPEMEDWLWAQRGRHWSNEMCPTGDVGRRAFTAVDTSDKCPELAAAGKCESKPKSTRRKCPRSCRIFMDDWEYQPGIERSKVIGDIGIEV